MRFEICRNMAQACSCHASGVLQSWSTLGRRRWALGRGARSDNLQPARQPSAHEAFKHDCAFLLHLSQPAAAGPPTPEHGLNMEPLPSLWYLQSGAAHVLPAKFSSVLELFRAAVSIGAELGPLLSSHLSPAPQSRRHAHLPPLARHCATSSRRKPRWCAK